MKTIFPKKECHVPKWFVIDATGKTLGRLVTEVSKILRGKDISFFTPGIDQGNFVVILNAEKIYITGKKENQKLYYRNSQRPGSLKVETFKQIKRRKPVHIIERAVWGMLPKNILGRQYYRRLYVYCSNDKSSLIAKKELQKVNVDGKNWIELSL
uniref:Ribosomal protein L13 n=1 Tax=Neotessella volvocina TaxID=52559 RepID=A0A3G2QZY5_9STRA|nr:ribosomal protein L13 [Neotessella volvocina]